MVVTDCLETLSRQEMYVSSLTMSLETKRNDHIIYHCLLDGIYFHEITSESKIVHGSAHNYVRSEGLWLGEVKSKLLHTGLVC